MRTRHGLGRCIVGVAGALLIGAAPLPPVSRNLEAQERTARELAITDESGSRQLPFAGFTVYQPARHEWTVFTFYASFREAADGQNRKRESYWVGRRVAGGDARRAGAAEAPDWASSDRCAALEPALRAMVDILSERLESALPDVSDASEADADPTRFRLWTDAGRFHGTGHAIAIAVSAAAGSPAADWSQETAAALAGCWSPDPPSPARAAAAPR